MSRNRKEEWLEANRAMWDERVPIHLRGSYYDVAGFKAGEERLPAFEVAEVGDVSGKEFLHLQCHFGMDTLGWARHGARVTGLDFSPAAIESARTLADEMSLEAEFVCANVYDARKVLGDRKFDVVYANLGTLNWVPDVSRWARVAARLTRPDGVLYISESHPFVDVFDDDELEVTDDYFRKEPYVWDEPGTYADPDAETANNLTYWWSHGLGEVVSAVIEADFRLEFLHEHDHALHPRWPFMEQSGPDVYLMPEGTPRLPLMYSLRARRSYMTRSRIHRH